jgi:hypothetical protein
VHARTLLALVSKEDVMLVAVATHDSLSYGQRMDEEQMTVLLQLRMQLHL